MSSDRRVFPRLPIDLEVEFWLGISKVPRSGSLRNLSAGGAALRTEEPVYPGTLLPRLHFQLPSWENHEPIELEVKAEVLRSNLRLSSKRKVVYEIGVRFLDLEEESFEHLQRFVFRNLKSGSEEEENPPHPVVQVQRVPIEQPVTIRFGRFRDFVNEVSENISMTGMFIRTRQPRPPGSTFDFEFQLGDDFPLIEGSGEVVWSRPEDEDSERPAGMGIRFVDLDSGSRAVIRRLVEEHLESGGAGFELEPEVTKESEAERAEEPPEPEGEPVPVEVAADGVQSQEEIQEAALSQQLAEVEAARASLAARLEELHGLLEAERAKTEGLALQVEQLGEVENRLQEAREELNREVEVRAEVEGRLESMVSRSAELEELIEAAAGERETSEAGLQDELATARGVAESLGSEVQEVQAALVSAQEEAAGLRQDATRVEELEKSLAGREEELGRLREERDGLTRELQEVGQRGGALASDLRARADTAEAEAARLEAELGEARDDLQTRESQVEGLEGSVQRLEEGLARIHQEREEKDAEAAAAAERRRALETELQAELQQARAELEAGRSSAAERELALTREKEEAEAREAGLRSELESLQAALAAAETGRRQMEERLGTQGGEMLTGYAEEPEAAGGRARRQSPWPLAASFLAGALIVGLGAVGVQKFMPSGIGIGGSPPARVADAETGVETAGATGRKDSVATDDEVVESAAEAQLEEAGPSPEPAPAGPELVAPEETVAAWAQAWSDQRVEDYVGFYAAEFTPPGGMSRAEWEENRRERLGRPAWIRVTVGGMEIHMPGDGGVDVTFDQVYESPTYRDEVRKTLHLVWQEEVWKIASEQTVEAPGG